MKYTNKDYYEYIIKYDTKNNPLHNTYEKIINLLIKEGLDKIVSENAIKTLFKIFEIRKYNLKEENIQELDNLLYYESAFKRAIKNENGTYSIYPKLKDLPSKNDLLLDYTLGLKLDVEEIITHLKPKVKEEKENLKVATIENYYGSAKYLVLHTKAIYDAMCMLKENCEMDASIEVENSINTTLNLLNYILATLRLNNNEETFKKLEDYSYEIAITKEQYDNISYIYKEILKEENKLVSISDKIWKEYGKQNGGCFVHQLTSNLVTADKMDKICVSFYSDNAQFITNYNNANTGYIYDMDISNTFTVCEEDVGSWRVTKEEFIERGMPENWQLDESNLWYEYPHHSKLFSPYYIEQEINKNSRFAEIILDNRSKNVFPSYCFYTQNASLKQIEEINELARLQNLEVKCLEIKNESLKKK